MKTTRIDSVFWLNTEGPSATIAPAVIKQLMEKYEYDLPENCFLKDLNDELDEQDDNDIDCDVKSCGTTNDSDAKFCKSCGTRLDRGSKDLEITSIDWGDDEDDLSDPPAAETFMRIFVKRVVPHIRGRIEAGICFSEEGAENVNLSNAYFVVQDGELTWCTLNVTPGALEPDFKFEAQENADEE